MNGLLQHGVSAQAQARPESVAVVCEGAHLAYGELEAASNRLAHLLQAAGCRKGDRVALLMPKSPTAIVALLGTLKAGAVCVPMDPDSPPARQARVLAQSECRCILAGGAAGALLREALAAAQLAQPPLVGWLDEAMPPPAQPAFTQRDLATQPDSPAAGGATPFDLALLLFTSGSTGQPKGVMLTHDSLQHFVRWGRAYFGLSSTDRVSQHAPLRFDIAHFDIFGALSAGAELHLVPARLNLLPHKLAQLIRESRLTQWFSVPAVLTLMAKFDAVGQDDFPQLRRVLFAGEVLPTPTLIHWMRRLPHVRFTNLYGPTETSISSSYYTVPRCPDDARAPLPIGTPCPGEELLVLDAERRPLPPGEPGELYIGGAGLSPGYWRDARRTAEAFVSGPRGAGRLYRTGDLARQGADGLFYYLGRCDAQIKSRGHRIELGEIEAALHTLGGLRESAVVAVASDGFEGALICCAYVPQGERGADAEALRRGLARLLPPYMLPARWRRYDALPKNESGKIDRPALRAAFQQAAVPETAAPLQAAAGRA